VAVVGDGSLTGGMAYEALNNLGHSNQRVVIVLNDNGRSYAPTISKLSESLTALRLNKTYLTMRGRIRKTVPRLPRVGKAAYLGIDGFTSVVREMVTPHTFFENLGVRYVGPIDGHDLESLEGTLKSARSGTVPSSCTCSRPRPRLRPRHRRRLEDARLQTARAQRGRRRCAPVVLASVLGLPRGPGERRRSHRGDHRRDGRPYGTPQLRSPVPDRFFDVGIAEQHAVTAAAGMAMGGLKPVVAIYSTFFSRAFDQAHLDVGLLNLPVVFVFDRPGSLVTTVRAIMASSTSPLPGDPQHDRLRPSSAEEVPGMLATALSMTTPTALRFPRHSPNPSTTRSATGSRP